MQAYFYALADYLKKRVQSSEQFTCWFSAEVSDFVRFNRGAIRQPGHVRQIYLSLNLIDGLRHANSMIALSGNLDTDRAILDRLFCDLRDLLPDLPEDPHLLISTEVCSTEHIVASRLPATSVIVDEVLAMAQSYDFVGILAAGPVYRGFANSFVQRNWHEMANFNLDWNLYQSRDKAVKTAYAGFDWDSTTFKDKFHAAAAQLEILKRDPVTLKLGAYRAYLTPTALVELIGMLNWDSFSEKSLRTKQSSLLRLRNEGLQLNPALTLSENISDGLAPGFQCEGFIKPERVTLLDHGRLSVSNLWYLNFSDRSNCRITGMTRFATFWVENGEIKAPLNVMRFDDSLFRLLGENLIGLTSEREMLIDSESYGARGTNSARLPGALMKNFTFVL